MKRVLLGFLLTLYSSLALAWPTKPISIIVPFSPGGFAGQIATATAADLEKSLNQPVLVKYMPGAQQAVALNHILNNENDNHTFLMTTDDLLVVSHVAKTNNHERFVGTNLLVTYSGLVFGGPGSSPEKLRQQIREGKTINVGNIQLNGGWHLWTVNTEGLNVNPVPYKGLAPLSVDVASGVLEYGISNMAGVWSMIQEGKLVPVMAASNQRLSWQPNVPTFRELGLKGDPAQGWNAYVARADTDPRALRAFSEAVQASARTNSFIQGLSARGNNVVNLGFEETNKFLAQDLTRVKRIKF